MGYKILVITLSNIGDVILTLPVLDFLMDSLPESKFTIMVSERPKEIFENNPLLERVIIYDKNSLLKDKIKLFFDLKKERFDIVVDLRNTLFGRLLPSKFKAHQFLLKPKKASHMRAQHLLKVIYPYTDLSATRNLERQALYISNHDHSYIEQILRENKIAQNDNLIVVSAGSRSIIKRWPKEKFAELIDKMMEEINSKVVLIGDKADEPINEYIASHSKYDLLDLSGRTTLGQAGALLRRALMLVTNDSANLHLASYLDVPVVAVFGPTDESKYGPWSSNCAVAKKEIFCRPCQKAKCRFKNLKCMQLVSAEDMMLQVREIIKQPKPGFDQRKVIAGYKRILIVRTDKVGDVILSTPVIKALRDAYPYAYIAAMIRPYTRVVLEGNPYLDELVIYDKDGKEKSWAGSLRFAWKLRKQRFDVAVILNPSNRGNLIPFLAGIPARVGYNRKLGFLLTHKVKDTKHLGQKHEIEYNLDLIRNLGVEPEDKNMFMPLNQDSENWAEDIFIKEKIGFKDRLVVINPASSDRSKMWPPDRYAAVADRLAEKGYRIIILGGPGDNKITDEVFKNMRQPAINMVGNNNISQAASLLRRCQVFISTDTGPMHLASSIGIPIVAIFGRKDRGLSPVRWGPMSKKSCVLQKDVGCEKCLAHNCKKEFLCLQAVTVDEVMQAAESLLS
jgi:heptosyltransferase-2